ncbi:hypothetical protein V6N11_034309 [Hibiscus sabdariffa]|uniref:Uncharacterized protein n=2 Tax=Hibiscus sabdariffa TaxID=183260 RepID=A0ABR1ZYJ8_9ROSI
MRYKLGQSIPLRCTLLFLTSLGRRASCGAFMPYIFIYYISLKVGSPESEDNDNSNKGPRKKGRANGDPPATKMTRSTERTGMITTLKAGIEENALNLLAHSTKTEKEVIGKEVALCAEKRDQDTRMLLISNEASFELRELFPRD